MTHDLEEKRLREIIYFLAKVIAWALRTVKTMWSYKTEVLRVIAGWSLLLGLIYLLLWLGKFWPF